MASLEELNLETLDFGAISAEDFARLVKNTGKRELAAAVSGPVRARVLDEVFDRMRDRFKPDAAGRLSAVVRWRIVDDGEPDAVYTMAIENGTCAVTKGAVTKGTATKGDDEREPRLTLTMAAVEFLRLASGNASGTTMFMTRRLKAGGDLSLAAVLTRYFDIPRG
jgi:predicted lipid carrier protein YhbT